jgi:hypothetical protein
MRVGSLPSLPRRRFGKKSSTTIWFESRAALNSVALSALPVEKSAAIAMSTKPIAPKTGRAAIASAVSGYR